MVVAGFTDTVSTPRDAKAEHGPTSTTTTTTCDSSVTPPPTYQSSEASTFYITARSLLNNGSFEEALTQIEQGIEETKKRLFLLSSSSQLSANDKSNQQQQQQQPQSSEEDMEFHEAMAPFHYLYGTTLLYSIEESTDAMAIPTTTTTSSAEPREEEEKYNHENAGDDDDDDNGAEIVNGNESPDDTEIAWENLELARTILVRMVDNDPFNHKLKLDLAQVYLREGDLHRMNGRHENAVEDYEACLKYREGNPLLEQYDRKIADVHYHLALVHMLIVAESKVATPSVAGDPEEQVQSDPSDSLTKIETHRGRSFFHYVQCARSLSGLAAVLCGADPLTLLQESERDLPKFKTTGEEDVAGTEHPNLARMKIRGLRDCVARLCPTDEVRDLTDDVAQMLQEIQETLDEAENSEQGVHEVAEMKAQITAAVAGVAAHVMPGEGTAANAVVTTTGFAPVAAMGTSAPVVQTLTTVRRKAPKRPVDEDIQNLGDDCSKRAKPSAE